MTEKSRGVTSNQPGIHEDLERINSKYDLNYKRPCPDFSKEVFELITSKIELAKRVDPQIEIYLDCGCGIGESTYGLAIANSEKLIIGIDKSENRLERKNHFKKESPPNMLIIRGELLDLWPLFYKSKIKFSKIFILYPNPYPKKTHVKKRWHANPVFPFLIELSDEFELRSNWKIYLEEFQFSSKLYRNFSGKLQVHKDTNFLTPFERKYANSGQELYRLNIKL